MGRHKAGGELSGAAVLVQPMTLVDARAFEQAIQPNPEAPFELRPVIRHNQLGVDFNERADEH